MPLPIAVICAIYIDYNNTYYHLVGLHILRKNFAFTGIAMISGELHSTLDEGQNDICLECDINIVYL